MNRNKQTNISLWVLLFKYWEAWMANATPSKTVAWPDGQTVAKWPSSVLNNALPLS
jgi:hypothetical protein